MFESWPVWLYRGVKIPTTALFGLPTEIFVHDRGDSGNNGKTVLQSLMEAVAGDYFKTLDEAMITRRPPCPATPNHALMQLRGARLLGMPETEQGITIYASWLKKLADLATMWAGRNPHDTEAKKFKIAATLCVCTNAKMLFTRVDGGMERRGVGCAWKKTFSANPQGPNGRQASPLNLKDPKVLMGFVPGYWYIMKAVHEVFYSVGHHATAGPLPQEMVEATAELLCDELACIIEEVINEDFTAAPEGVKGLTYAKISTIVKAQPTVQTCTKDMKMIDAVLERFLTRKTVKGCEQTPKQ